MSTPAAAPAAPTATPAQAKGTATPTDAPLPGASTETQPPKSEFPRKVAGNYKGKTVEREFSSDAEWQAFLQKGLGADEAFREAARVRQEQQAFRDKFKKDRLAALKELDPEFDPDSWAEQRVLEKYKESEMPEHERRIMEAERKAQELQRKLEERENAERTAKEKEQLKQHEARWEGEIIGVLEQVGYSDKGFAKSVLMPQVIDVLIDAAKGGYNLTPQQAAAEVQRRIDAQHTRFLGGLDGDALLKRLGPEMVKKIIRAEVARTRVQAAPATPANVPPQPEPEPDVRPNFADNRKLAREALFGRVRGKEML